MRSLSIVVVLLLSGFAANAYEIPFGQLRETCDKFLKTCVETSVSDQIAKKLASRVRQRLADNPDQADDVAMRSIMLDWAAGASKDLENRKPDAVNMACYYFTIFYDKGFDIPHQIRDQLDEATVTDILGYLNERIDETNKNGGIKKDTPPPADNSKKDKKDKKNNK